jgi:hypothetical protein
MLAGRIVHMTSRMRVLSVGRFCALSTAPQMAPSSSSTDGSGTGGDSAPRIQNTKPRHRLVSKAKGQQTSIEVIPTQNVLEAIEVMKSKAWANFDETVEIAVKLGVDPRKPNQAIKGVAVLPHGNGKKVRVAVFAKGNDATDAAAAGADVVGAEDLVLRVQTGDFPFDRVIATPEMMTTISKLGKVVAAIVMMFTIRLMWLNGQLLHADFRSERFDAQSKDGYCN